MGSRISWLNYYLQIVLTDNSLGIPANLALFCFHKALKQPDFTGCTLSFAGDFNWLFSDYRAFVNCSLQLFSHTQYVIGHVSHMLLFLLSEWMSKPFTQENSEYFCSYTKSPSSPVIKVFRWNTTFPVVWWEWKSTHIKFVHWQWIARDHKCGWMKTAVCSSNINAVPAIKSDWALIYLGIRNVACFVGRRKQA